jgi:hypothetical protein
MTLNFTFVQALTFSSVLVALFVLFIINYVNLLLVKKRQKADAKKTIQFQEKVTEKLIQIQRECLDLINMWRTENRRNKSKTPPYASDQKTPPRNGQSRPSNGHSRALSEGENWRGRQNQRNSSSSTYARRGGKNASQHNSPNYNENDSYQRHIDLNKFDLEQPRTNRNPFEEHNPFEGEDD